MWGLTGMLALDDVTFAYPGRMPVLQHLDLTVEPGELRLVAGRNGTGKTTLLKLAAGVLRPNRGTVRAGARCAYVAVDVRFHESLTVTEEIRYLAAAGGRDERELAARLSAWGFDGDLMTQEMSALSSGWRQRFVLAVASASRAPLLLLDEPFANLDRDGVALTVEWIDSTVRSGGTVVVVDHGDAHTAVASPVTRTDLGAARNAVPHG